MSRDKSVGLDIGMKITICHGQRGLDSTGSSRPLATADITSVAYCDKEQVIFRMKIKGDLTTSMLSMPVCCTSIGLTRRLLYQLLSFSLPAPPPLPKSQSLKRSSLSSSTAEDDLAEDDMY